MELREWQYMNKPAGSAASNSSTSSGYKKRFEKLIKYHIDHASSELERVNNKVINEYDFHLSEHYNTGSDEFNRTIIVSVNKYTDEFFLSIFVDGKEVYHNVYKSYGEVLEILTDTYMFLPDKGTQDYDDLLTESLNEWKYMNPPTQQTQASASSTKGGYWERFNKLLFYHVNHKSPAVDKVVRTKVSKDGFHYTEHIRAGTTGYDKDVVVNIDLAATEDWKFQTYIDGKPHIGGAGYGYVKLLKELRKHMNLPAEGTPEYTKLLTESLSIADDFKLYENLWEDIDVEEYNMVLGRTSYNLYDDSDLDAYLTQSARLMRKPVGNEKPLEFFKLQKINKMLRTPKYYNNKKLADKLLRVKAELENKLT